MASGGGSNGRTGPPGGRSNLVVLHPGRRTVSEEAVARVVAANQRARLYGAMIELVASRGYAGSTVGALCARSGVSEDALYELFPGGREQCFLATYDLLVHNARLRILGVGSHRPRILLGVSPHRQLRTLAQQFARTVAGSPDAATLVLVESLRAGPRGPALSERTERTRALIERVLSHGLRSGPDQPPPEQTVVRELMREGTRLLRERLCEGRMQGLETELVEVCLAAIGPSRAG
jgi:AcrR family transcriptional regulator